MEGLNVSDANWVVYMHPSKANKASQAIVSSLLFKVGKLDSLEVNVNTHGPFVFAAYEYGLEMET